MGKLADYLYADEAECVNGLLNTLDWNDERAQKVTGKATELVKNLRKQKRKMGELEVFMHQYSLDTEEGLALMCLAEALLRVPDKKTANDLIKDKVAANDWLKNTGMTKDWMVKAAGYGLSFSSATLKSMAAKMGEPVIREAMVQAMRIMGSQFVLGRTIEEAFRRAKDFPQYRMSYDMLGEGARTAKDAERYFEAYKHAIEFVGQNIDRNSKTRTPGVSVKLSALHPRYEFAQKERCVPALIERLSALCALAKSYDMALTVDAEEFERLEISLEIIEAILKDKQFEGWDGYGLAIQGYQKRCFYLIDRLAETARVHGRKMQVRLVKGAYWDTEIKHCQVEGYEGYPVFTRKVNTDLSYMACAQKMLGHGDVFYSMFATHNAHTIAAILQFAKDNPQSDYEFQRLHGMGEGLYDLVMKENPDLKVSVYAPVGPHSDLLAYLVRRLLENGANSSFVNKIMDDKIPAEDIVSDPVKNAREHNAKRHTAIAMPSDIFPGRLNSHGIDLNDADTATEILEGIASCKPKSHSVQSLLASPSTNNNGEKHGIISPADKMHKLGDVTYMDTDLCDNVFNDAQKGYEHWSNTAAEIRATALEKIADLLEVHHIELMALCVYEAGKTIRDAHLEIREAVDFCRYYAQQGRKIFNTDGQKMPGPTGESNILYNYARGTFVCISPWNFPLAIFTGQITAALMAGNAVIAKPAEQTCIIAHKVVQLMHQAGVPKNVLQLALGDGKVGGAL
ncbi:MAG: bifunctional proline dehydrogenase/L-glutamate gamma-semialdehyde dehydrogenase PutA, partial [Alphaproteobacteria bacterium]